MTPRIFAATVALWCTAAVADANISGTITDPSSNGIVAQVRLWSVGTKGFTLTTTVNSAADGTYSFPAVVTGSYVIDARPASGTFTDRWYDVAAPNGSGYVAADADVLNVQTSDFNGINIQLENSGGMDGTVSVMGTLTGGMQARFQRKAIVDIHHNDVSQGDPHLGDFFLRDLPPANDYQLLVHDPMGLEETYVDTGPYTVTAGMNGTINPAAMSPMPADPNEPNDSVTATGAAIDGGIFRTTPPGTFQSSGAIVAPRGADLDYYCFNALQGDRFLISAKSNLGVQGAFQEDPWVDPVLSVWSVDMSNAVTKLFEDDDSGPGFFDSFIDTQPLPASTRLCVAVSTFGDVGWTGAGQSAGHYDLTIKMGNRPPALTVTYDGGAPPVPPATITINEGDSLELDLAYADPDNDTVTVTDQFSDSSMASATGSTFNVTGTTMGTAKFVYDASQVAAQKSPYTVTFTVKDAEFTITQTVDIVVNAVNVPPTMPLLLSPIDGGFALTHTPDLQCTASTDVDLDPLSYDFELTYGDGGVQQLLNVIGDGGSTIDAVPAALPENTKVTWRARAYDGHPSNGYSPWTAAWNFFVDTMNDPPTTPVLTKPVDGDNMIMVRRPALEATNPTDPENDGITLQFTIASDMAFTNVVMQSPAVPLDMTGTSTAWMPTADLAWGGNYYARVQATDSRGASSAFSNVNNFGLKPNIPPTDPTLQSPFAVTCSGLVVSSASSLGIVQVGASSDPEGETVTLQLQIFNFADDPMTATPLFDKTLPNTVPITNFNTSSVAFVEDGHYLFRARAYDGSDYSSWVQCDATLNAIPNTDGGSGGGAGGGSGGGMASGGGSGTDAGSTGGGGNAKAKSGCGCGAIDSGAWFALLAAAASLRRRGKSRR